ncbi:MAG TPA: 5'-nucleotidase C-terminal domain-containing protein [Actinomycetota bacterium]|nr:5'-nucleotidase C-terminal domain-containing protein [Actinomycetota bacterium]
MGHRTRRIALSASLALLAGGLLAPAAAAPAAPIQIQLLSVSDWHAQLDPVSVSGVGDVGGAAALSSYFRAERAANPNTLTLTAGDAYGASPPLSGFFDEEPAVKAMNLMGFDADTFGNHNFDRGVGHLQRMIDLAEFPYVSANLRNVEGNLTGVRPYEIFDVSGIKVAVIGLTNPEAPELVTPGSLGTIEITDPVQAANRARAQARREGAKVFVIITHMGVTGFDAAGQPVGPLVDLANAVGGFDLIVGDHTDIQYRGVINDQLVVENRSKGLTYARTVLSVNPTSGRVIDASSEFVTPRAASIAPDPAVVQMLRPYRDALVAAMDQPAGVATGVFPRAGNIERLREVALGNLITDAMRETYGTQIAVQNGGGIRAPLPSSYLPADTSLRRTTPGYAAGPPYDLVVGDIYTVLPFGNAVLTRTVTGLQLWSMLEHSVAPIPSSNGRFLQVSGFRFTYDAGLPPGSRVLSVTLDDGTSILPDATTYTLATNNFMNAGGDGYTMLADGQGVTRDLDANVLLEYIRSKGTITPTIEGRITRLN